MAISDVERQRKCREKKRLAAVAVNEAVTPIGDDFVTDKQGVRRIDSPQLATLSDESLLASLVDAVFIDWLTIYQVYRPGTVPLVGSEYVVYTSLETGEDVCKRVTSFQHEGSFDTRLHVRCDGEAVMVSGNPSAYGRLDNLFGVRTMVEAVQVFNGVLRLLGLPEFDLPGEGQPLPPAGASVAWDAAGARFVERGGRQSAFYDSLLADGRPRITCVHLTVNLETSDPVGFLRQISGFVYKGKPGYLYPNGRSVDWPMAKGLQKKYSRRVYHKYYDKVYELQCKVAALHSEKKKDPLNLILQFRLRYLEKLLAWAKLHGIVRREVELKSTEIISRGLTHIQSWSSEVMAKVIYPYQFHHKLKTEETRLDNLYDHFIGLEYSKAVAAKVAMLHRCWINGDDVRQLAGSRQTFDRYRNLLLSVGVDIAQPCNISRIVLRAERFTWSHLQAPDWYIQPSQPVDLDCAASL